MTFSINVISDVKAFSRIEESWNAFASKNSETPFILSEFMKSSMKRKLLGWNPLLMIGRVNDAVVGIIPLVMTRKLGVRIASFPSPHYSLDFVINERFREKFIDSTLDYLFKTLRCKVLDLTFPAESNNMHLFQELCRKKNVYFGEESFMGRRMLEVRCSWEQFEDLKGGKFRRRFRKMQNKLNRVGSCQVSCVEREDDENDAFSRIIQIEKNSWKETWRSKKGKEMDRDLIAIWEGAGCASKKIPDFKRGVWFLELNDHPIAYALVLQHKRTATITKTSFDARYRRFYPGMYLINALLPTLFNSNNIEKVDFMTDMSFMEAWTDLCLGRVRVLAGKGILPTTVLSLYQEKQMRRMLNIITNQSLLPVASLFG